MVLCEGKVQVRDFVFSTCEPEEIAFVRLTFAGTVVEKTRTRHFVSYKFVLRVFIANLLVCFRDFATGKIDKL